MTFIATARTHGRNMVEAETRICCNLRELANRGSARRITELRRTATLCNWPQLLVNPSTLTYVGWISMDCYATGGRNETLPDFSCSNCCARRNRLVRLERHGEFVCSIDRNAWVCGGLLKPRRIRERLCAAARLLRADAVLRAHVLRATGCLRLLWLPAVLSPLLPPALVASRSLSS